jgi:hypothetical protein
LQWDRKFYTLLFLMTNNIYPPDHLLRKWKSLIIDEEQNVDVVLYEAFQAGADQELEACCDVLKDWGSCLSPDLHAARRPKPPSLKEQALAALEQVDGWAVANMSHLAIHDDLVVGVNTIRRALEQLDD